MKTLLLSSIALSAVAVHVPFAFRYCPDVATNHPIEITDLTVSETTNVMTLSGKTHARLDDEVVIEINTESAHCELNTDILELCDYVACPLEAGTDFSFTFYTSRVQDWSFREIDIYNNEQMLLCFSLQSNHTVSDPVESLFYPALSEETIHAVNSQRTSWVAGENKRFYNATLWNAKRLMGTVLNGEFGHVEAPLKVFTPNMLQSVVIPIEFDARKEWSQCADVIGHVRDQSDCGSCWAFSSTEVFNDRMCIVYGDTDTLYSPEDTVACCNGLKCSFSMGCNGGQPSGAWNWFVKEGVVSGGDYTDIGTDTTCLPYEFPPCSHHVEPTPEYPVCPEEEYATPSCKKSCSESGYGKTYLSDKTHAQNSYSVRGVQNIQTEIMTKGPVSAALTVYSDFLTYKSGVYKHVTGDSLGGHAVKMIGWGVEDGVDYWLMVNSWNPTWGDNGLFKIVRGQNECGIESNIVAGEV